MTIGSWRQYQGKVIEGVGSLGAFLGSSDESAVYVAETGDSAKVIKIRLDDGQGWLARWQSAMALEHPHLIRLYDAGSCVLDGVPLIYAVMERADETLAEALSVRPLSETETREMLEPVVSALGYLHRKAFAHGELRAANVMARGDQLKLSCDKVKQVRERAKQQEDIRALGMLIVEALTREVPVLDSRSGEWVLPAVSEPFRRIARHCLESDPDKQWNTERIAAELNPVVAAPPAAVPSPSVSETRAIYERKAPSPVPDEEADERPGLLDGVAGRLKSVGQQAGPRTLLYVGLVIVALSAAVFGLRRSNHGPEPVASANAPVSAPVNEPASAPEPAPVPSTTPAPAHPPRAAISTPPPRAEASPVSAGDKRGAGWVVVVATYAAREAADKRAHAVAKKWPRFHVEVYQPPAEKPYHMVVIGRNLSENEAGALRKRAIASGFPRDTYIRRFPG